jgi:hypothetical protein
MIAETISADRPRRWTVPPIAARRNDRAVDEASRSLARAARGVLMRVPHVIGECLTASHGQIELLGYLDDPAVTDRAWRYMQDQHEIFCVIDDASERMLLSWIVGGAPARAVSTIERNIVDEAIRGLLLTSPDDVGHFREEQRVRPLAQAWRCDVRMYGHSRERAVLHLFAACTPRRQPDMTLCTPDLCDVALQLRATLPGVACLAQVAAWRLGSLLRLNCAEHDVAVALDAGGRRLAIAQLGAIRGSRALRVVNMWPSAGQ